jgi:hypothetical protein
VTKPIRDAVLTGALNRAKERYLKRRNLRECTTRLEKRWMDTADELARMLHFQRFLIERSIDGVIARECRGKAVLFNRSDEELLGDVRTQVTGKMSLMELFPPLDP